MVILQNTRADAVFTKTHTGVFRLNRGLLDRLNLNWLAQDKSVTIKVDDPMIMLEPNGNIRLAKNGRGLAINNAQLIGVLTEGRYELKTHTPRMVRLLRIPEAPPEA